MTIAFVTVIVLVLGSILAVLASSDSRRAGMIVKNYPQLVMAHLNLDTVPSSGSLCDKQIKQILSLSNSDWEDWKSIKKEQQTLSESYPESFDAFLSESFPNVKERKSYKVDINSDYEQSKIRVAAMIAALTIKEIRILDAETKENWEHRKKIREQAIIIRKKYPQGVMMLAKFENKIDLSDEDIIRQQNSFEQYQQLNDRVVAFDGWEKKQEAFAQKFYDISKECRESDGRYTYQVPYKKPTKEGTSVDSEFKLWQCFLQSYSSYCLDIQNQDYLNMYNNVIPEFKTRKRSFNDSIHDGLLCVLDKVTKYLGSKPLVVFVYKSHYRWSKNTYSFHYKHLLEVLDENGCSHCKYEELQNIDNSKSYDCIVIIDAISSNDEMFHRCRMVVEYFTKHIPFVCYYSYIKEYSQDEIIRICNKNLVVPTSSQSLIEQKTQPVFPKGFEYILGQFQRVKMDSFFSYTAIPNTLMGEAQGALETKEKWMDEPTKTKIIIDKDENDGFIRCRYSINGGESFDRMEFKGDKNSIEDVARFSYAIFIKTGTLEQFMRKGENAIDIINQCGWLTRR